jgi:prolyl-tRNA editing enzyme YbaK/EbsC (Cys-tRNA(Pro) deacylase)
MSSLERVRAALAAAGVAADIREMPDSTRTAEEAAAACGCTLDQIVKSIIFRGDASGHVKLFLTAGGNRVDAALASGLAGEALGKADAGLIRAETGFAIGGVAPVGHLTALPVWMDPRLMDFPVVWAAAGTPRHVFAIAPQVLERITGASVARFVA